MENTLIYSHALEAYDFGPGHPFRSDRFSAFLQLYRQQLAADERFQLIINDNAASDEELQLWHTADYINIVRAASIEPDDLFDQFGGSPHPHINIMDCGPKQGPCRQSLSVYLSPEMLDPLTGMVPPGLEPAARAAVKNSLLAVDLVRQGRTKKAINIGGGFHHALAGSGEGFCLYNDVVIAARYALQKHDLDRVLILDTDAHAGNGTCKAFYADPRVLFIDLHQQNIYPGTGRLEEIGAGDGTGCTVNVPLPTGTGDAGYEMLFDELITPLARGFQPQLIIRNGGSDPHRNDRLTDLGLSMTGLKMIGENVRRIAAEHCDSRCVDLIGSGYNPATLPQTWLAQIAGLTGLDIPIESETAATDYTDINDIKAMITRLKAMLPFFSTL